MASVLQGPTCDDIDECKINLLTVYVKTCPSAGDVVCTYEIDAQLPKLTHREEVRD